MGATALAARGGRAIRWVAAAVLMAVVVALLPPAVGTASSAVDGRPVSVIVQAQPGAIVAAARLVDQLGGTSAGSCR